MDRKMVNFIKEQYPPGTRIRLNAMDDPYHPILPGTEGEVDFVDDEGQIFIKWDNGRTLPLAPGEDSFTVLPPKLTTLKLYMPLTADLYERNEYGDFDDSSTLLEGRELRGYQDQITAALVKNRMPEETERGLMHWYDEVDSVNTKVRTAVFTVEERDRQLWGVAECRVAGELSDTELGNLKEYLTGQASDGWGEGFEQREISVDDGGELHVHLWNSDEWSIQTEQELFSPKLAEGLPEMCFSTLPGTGELICIKRGESGYYPSDWNTNDPAHNQELADYNNERLGVTQEQRLAMECGSMHGWGVPGADPSYYEQKMGGMKFGYLETYHMTARELAKAMILDVLRTTGITATAGIGTNLYLCKVAMDIMAKHVAPDEDGVRIAELDEMSYRRQLWAHRPLTDFWRVGRGYAKKLEAVGIYTMGDIAKCSVGKPSEYYNEELLYQMFGINAELLIDHAWGWEPCRMQDIKAYRPETNSISSGQVLQCPYPYDKARLVVREMAEAVAMDLLEKRLVTDQLTLTVGYDIENTAGGNFRGEIVTDRYGRKIPKHAHGTMNLPRKTSSARGIMDAILGIYDEKVNPKLSVRRITITANKIVSEDDVPQEAGMPVQFNLFDDIAAQEQQHKDEEIRLERERKIQEAMLGIKKKFGKNAILNGGSYLDGATARERNGQIGGHKA